MNEIKHIRIVIDADVWQPQSKETQRELDDLLCAFRTKDLLKHYGNIRTSYTETSDNEKKED